MEQAVLPVTEEIKDLREKTEKDFVNSRIKKALIGGYDKDDVLKFIAGLRARELESQQTFSGRIKELSALLQNLEQQKNDLSARLEKAIEWKNTARSKLEELSNQCEALQDKLQTSEVMISEYEKKCGEYETQVQSMKVDYEAVQSAKRYKALYEEISASYQEISASRDEYMKSDALHRQENEQLKRDNERFSKENEDLYANFAALTSRILKAGLSANLRMGTYNESHQFLLNSLICSAESTLQNLRDLQEKEIEWVNGLQDDLMPFRSV